MACERNDYYPFGMMMPGRKYDAGNLYRYGFNGKENDNEVKGEANQQDYGMRIYDGRLGRFLSMDPMAIKFAFYTPYQFASNSPIASIDIDGAESKVTIFSNKTSQINNTVPDKGGISAGAREAQTRLEVINWLLPKLKVPSTLYSDMLTPEEKSDIIFNTINEFITFNYTESISKNVFGQNIVTQTSVTDVDYFKLFGNEKFLKVEIIKDAFESVKPVFDSYSEATGKMVFLKNSLEGAEVVKNIINQDYRELTLQAIENGGEFVIQKGVENSLKLSGVATGLASFIARSTYMTIGFVLTPTSAPSTTLDQVKTAKKSIATKDLITKTVSSLLFYFMMGNQLSTGTQTSNPSLDPTPAPIDHTLFKKD